MGKPPGKAVLVRELAELYGDDQSVRRLLDFAGISTTLVRFGSRAMDTWFSALTEADNRRRRADLLKVILLEHPDNDVLHGALRDTLGSSPGSQRGSMSSSTGGDVEKIMGSQSTLLPVSFLEVGLARARSIGRISTSNGSVGTGFLISNNLVVTNHHVLRSSTEAESSVIGFNYQADPDGLIRRQQVLPLQPTEGFATSIEDDLTLVRTTPQANDLWGEIHLEDFDHKGTERVNIIQHPGGGPKQIALYHNIVSHIDDDILQYYTDTLPGSSGSPLFDDRWRLVGVHHAGGDLYSPTEKSWVYRNEGITVGRLKILVSELMATTS